MIYDSIIIGAGLMGSAAAKYISESEKNVALIGPDEEMVSNQKYWQYQEAHDAIQLLIPFASTKVRN